jgi:hypothetical protein
MMLLLVYTRCSRPPPTALPPLFETQEAALPADLASRSTYNWVGAYGEEGGGQADVPLAKLRKGRAVASEKNRMWYHGMNTPRHAEARQVKK